jgi:hypothetical protein
MIEYILTTEDCATLRARVILGAQWLNANYPGWHRKIDMDDFCMSSTCGCVCGQLFHGYSNTPQEAIAQDVSFGFDLPVGRDDGRIEKYAFLEEVWKEIIESKLKEDVDNGI